MEKMTKEIAQREFQRQVNNLLQKGYPKAAELTNDAFTSLLTSLKKKLDKVSFEDADIENGKLPFVIVIKNSLVATEIAMDLVEKNGKKGITKLYPHTPNDFETIPEESIPSDPIYLISDIDRGKSTINMAPNEAIEIIRKNNRRTLTIDEGIAIVTQYPEFLIKNNCFSLLASRHEGDQRVSAIWINANKHPNLGWCWNGNPHTWLGSASCKSRL